MSGQYTIRHGVPIPPAIPRGRKLGSHDSTHKARQSAISAGVAMVKSGESFVAAARSAAELYPKPVSERHLARLISEALKTMP